MAAIRALETRSREFMREKQEKKRLEERITMLQAKILMGGAAGLNLGNLQEIPAFRNALKEHQERIRQEYEGRLQDLEKERETIEEEKAQVDRYKQLLLKQCVAAPLRCAYDDTCAPAQRPLTLALLRDPAFLCAGATS